MALTHRIDRAAAMLWTSAFILAGMILMQAGKFGAPEAASAGNLADAGQIRLLTADAGGGEEFLAVLNITEETISIYGVQNQRSVELYQVAKLPDLFEQAKGGSPNRR